MILPDFSKSFEYENNFYLSCDSTRMAKVLSHYELFKMCRDLPGAIVECGVFKGASLLRFAAFRDLFGGPFSQKIIGFDIFGEFPETDFDGDKAHREKFIRDTGDETITVEQLQTVIAHKGLKNIELVQGNVIQTVPEYVAKNPALKIALLNLDTDVYEPAVTILENLYPRIVKGGVLILDDYALWPGETQAVDEYFKDKNVKILKHPFAVTPCYIIKQED